MNQIDRIGQKEAINLLAFLRQAKIAQRNSVLYKDAWYKMGYRLGVDAKTVKKYFTIALQENLCHFITVNDKLKGKIFAYKFVSYSNAAIQLLALSRKEANRFRLGKSKSSFQEAKSKVELELVGLNLRKQSYNRNLHFPNKLNITNQIKTVSRDCKNRKATGRKIKALVKKFGQTDEILKQSKAKQHKDSLVTGCKHISKLIGKSPSTASKRIKLWQKQEILSTKDIFSYTPVKSKEEAYAVLEFLRKSDPKACHYPCHQRAIKTVRGKQILSFRSSTFCYGDLSK